LATALAIALFMPVDGKLAPGQGGFMLWPLFGATNQLLAGLALLVIVFYLLRRKKPLWFAVIPMILMMIMPAWAMIHSLYYTWGPSGNLVHICIAIGILLLQFWMIFEGALAWPKARRLLETVASPPSHMNKNE
ncbi:MAG: hypothetical protein MPJ24_00910, partial [Pirellulaceae bacterium]|nr:hypothetical protein [Pirellulaceae bacterium]